MKPFYKLCESNIYTNCIQFLKVIFHLHYDKMGAVFLVLYKTSLSLFYTPVCAETGPKPKRGKRKRRLPREKVGRTLPGWREKPERGALN